MPFTRACKKSSDSLRVSSCGEGGVAEWPSRWTEVSACEEEAAVGCSTGRRADELSVRERICVFLAWRELGVGDNKVSPLPWMLISSSGYEERLSEEKVTEERRNTPSCARIREAPPMELEEFVRLPSNAALIRERDTITPSLA